MDVKTLQERLEQRATQLALDEAKTVTASLPMTFGNVRIPPGYTFEKDGETFITWTSFKDCLRKFLEDRFYEENLDDLTQELLNKVA